MAPISEQQQPRESEAQSGAATSHDAPVPNQEAATVDDDLQEQQQHAVKRARADFLAGIRKLIKSFKSLSHIFEIYKGEEDDDENDEDMDDTSIEIGFPTNVQHVAHIGLGGSTDDVSSLKLLSLSNLTTLEQFELAMASLANPEHNGVLQRVPRS